MLELDAFGASLPHSGDLLFQQQPQHRLVPTNQLQ